MPGMKPTMDEFKRGGLHSGSKTGPVVKSRAQAIAIGMNDKGGKDKGKQPPQNSFAAQRSIKAL